MAVKSYSTTAADNTSVNGVNTAEGMAPSDVNNAMREMMADIRSEVATKGTNIASASSIDLGAATGDFVDVTGTTTITALGTVSAGIRRTVRFTGALTLTHDGTSLILPGGANITTADGDIARFRSLGSGNWVCEGYSKADGGVVSSNYAKLDASNVFTANQTVRKTSGGATQILHADHDTAGTLAGTNYNQDNDSAVETIMAQIEVVSSDLTDGSEDALMRLRTIIAGTLATRLNLGAGLWMDGATGGDPGAGKINAADYEIDGVSISPQIAKAWVNFNGNGTVGISEGYNVSSVTDISSGRYQVNFATALNSGSYSIAAFAGDDNDSGLVIVGRHTNDSKTASACVVRTQATSGAHVDPVEVGLHFFGN